MMALVLDESYLEKALAMLGYPGFAHLVVSLQPEVDRTIISPTELIFWTINQDAVDVRLLEAIPWVIAAYAVKTDWQELIGDAQRQNVQNRLGYLVHLAIQLVKLKGLCADSETHLLLEKALLQLRNIRQPLEQTLMEEWSGPALRDWMRVNRPHEAVKWHLLTTLTINDLQHAG